MDADANHLWQKYHATHSDQDRNAIFEHYWPWVQAKATAIILNMRRRLNPDELMSYVAMRILEQTIPNYNPAIGTAFTTLLYWHIRGAIADAMRSLSPQGRRAYLRRGSIGRLRNDVSQLLGRQACDAEVAQHTGIPESSIIASEVARVIQVPWPQYADEPMGHIPPPIQPEDKNYTSLPEAAQSLSARDRRLLELYYLHGLRMREIAETFDVSTAYVSESIRKARLRLLRHERRSEQRRY